MSQRAGESAGARRQRRSAQRAARRPAAKRARAHPRRFEAGAADSRAEGEASRDAEIRAGWVEAGRRTLATGCVEAVDLAAAPSEAHAKPLYMRLTAAGRRYAG